MGEISESIGTWAVLAYIVGEPIMGKAASSLHHVAMDMPGYRDPGARLPLAY